MSRWTGPYVVKHVSPYGVIEIHNKERMKSFKVNKYKLKAYFVGAFDKKFSIIVIK